MIQLCNLIKINVTWTLSRLAPDAQLAYGNSRFCFLWNLQNRPMSTICKLYQTPSASLHLEWHLWVDTQKLLPLNTRVWCITLSRFLLLPLLPGQIHNAYTATAPVPVKNYVYRDKTSTSWQPCTAKLPVLKKLCALAAKNRAITVLHRDYSMAKVSGQVPGAAPVNGFALYPRAVSCNNKVRHEVASNNC